jgi:hypothetical protein
MTFESYLFDRHQLCGKVSIQVCVGRSRYTDLLSRFQLRQYYLAKAALTELSNDFVRRHVRYDDESGIRCLNVIDSVTHICVLYIPARGWYYGKPRQCIAC